MTCFKPRVAWWYKPEYQDTRPGGLSRPVFISEWQGGKYDYSVPLRVPYLARPCLSEYHLPCGKCEGCLMDRMQQWVFRALCELDEHENSFFLTLTVDDNHIDAIFPGKRLQYRPFQLFLKRLRRLLGPFRFMMCGEYGSHTLRPHYHVIVFGAVPPDLELLYTDSDKGYSVYTSSLVGGCWSDPLDGSSYGYHTISQANEATIRYLVGYVLKKVPESMGGFRPFLRVSSRPALGLSFFRKYYLGLYSEDYKGDFPNSFVFLGKKHLKLPRYFDKRFKLIADNADYVSLLKYRARCAESISVEKCDLDRRQDFFRMVTKASHNKRGNEV